MTASSNHPAGVAAAAHDQPLHRIEQRWVDRFTADYAQGKLELTLSPGPSIGIMKAVDDSKTSATQLSQTILQDPGLTAAVLRLANSPMFGASSQPLSLEQAVVRVGKKQLKGLLLSALLSAKVSKGSPVKELAQTTWRHSMICARVAETLAPKRKGITEAAFLAGLFHDIGSLALLQAIQKREAASRQEPPTRRAMLEVVGELSEAAAGQVIHDWALPRYVVQAVLSHRDFMTATPNPLSALVALCKDVTQDYGLPIGEACEHLDRHPALVILKLSPDDLPTREAIAELASLADAT